MAFIDELMPSLRHQSSRCTVQYAPITGNGKRGGLNDEPAISCGVLTPRGRQQVRQADDRQLPGLDADVERHQRREELGARQPEFAQHAGEAHSVQQAEREHQRDAPRLQLARERCSRSRRRRSTARSAARRPATAARRRRRSSGPSVIECASVNALTWISTGASVLSRKMPSTNRMWSSPFGRMWVNPRTT